MNLASRVGNRQYAADMQQIISAIDGMLGHSDWRRRRVVRLGSGAHAAGLDLGDAPAADIVEPHTRVTVICSGTHMQTLLDAALAAGATFTNDRYPRATEPDLSRLRPSEPTGSTLPTLVREGASIGAPSRSVKEPAKPLNPCTTSS